MNCIDLYRFGSIGYSTTLTARPEIFEKALGEGRNDFDTNCHRFLLVGDYEYYTFPIVFRQYDGKRLRDFLDTGWPPVYLISDRVVSLLKDNSITGWHNYPVKLFDKKGNLIEGYSGFSVLGKAGFADVSFTENAAQPKRHGALYLDFQDGPAFGEKADAVHGFGEGQIIDPVPGILVDGQPKVSIGLIVGDAVVDD